MTHSAQSSLAVLLSLLCLSTSLSAAAPILIVQWGTEYQTQEAIVPYDRIFLDASLSYDPQGHKLYYTFRFGDEIFQQESPVKDYYFSAPGIYAISVIVSDKKGASTLDDRPAPMWTRLIEVRACDCCLRYAISVEKVDAFHVLSLQQAKTYQVDCKIHDPSGIYGSDSLVLGRRFHALGEYPTLKVDTESIIINEPFSYNITTGSWNGRITARFNTTASRMVIQPKGIRLMGSCISERTIELSISRTLPFFTEVTSVKENTMNNIRSVQQSSAACAPYVSLQLLSPANMLKQIGGTFDATVTSNMTKLDTSRYAIMSYDALGPGSKLVNLVGNQNNGICHLLPDCSDLVILGVEFNQYSIFILSQKGIFYSDMLNDTLLQPELQRVLLSEDLQNAIALRKVGLDKDGIPTIRIYAGSACLPVKIYDIYAVTFIAYRTAGGDVAIERTISLPYDTWEKVTLENPPAGWILVDIVFDYVGMKTIAVIKEADQLYGLYIGEGLSLKLIRSLQFNSSTIHGIKLFDIGGVVVLYGDRVWISYNGANDFTEYRPNLMKGEAILEVKVMKKDMSFGFLTNQGRIFYMRGFSDGGLIDLFVPPLSTENSSDMKTFRSFQFDLLDNLLVTYYRFTSNSLSSLGMRSYFGGREWGQNATFATSVFPMKTVLEYSFLDQSLPLGDDGFVVPYRSSQETIYLLYATRSMALADQVVFSSNLRGTMVKFGSEVGIITRILPITSPQQIGGYYLTSHGIAVYLSTTPSTQPGSVEYESSIEVEIQGANRVAILKLLNENSSWKISHIGQSVMLDGTTILITSISSKSTAMGVAFLVGPTLNAAARRWRIYDFKSRTSLADYPITTSVTLSNIKGENLWTMSLNDKNARFTNAMAYSIFRTDNLLGVIISVDQNGKAKVSFTDKRPTTDPSVIAEWDLENTLSGYDTNLVAFSGYSRAWSIQSAPCTFSEFTQTGNLNETVYLDHEDSFSVSASLLPSTSGDVHMSVTESNNLDLSFEESVPSSPQSPQTFSVTGSETVNEAISQVFLYPQPYSVLCPQSLVTKTVVLSCPPAKFLKEVFPHPLQSFMEGREKTESGDAAARVLPVNYRPPSHMGIAIPLTNNIYHADPSKPMYRSVLDISKKTGEYKQCRGKMNRTDCGCDFAQKTSWLERDSDCVERVRVVYYFDNYEPKFVISEDGVEEELKLPIKIKEVNGRDDYCIQTRKGGFICGSRSKLEDIELSPEDGDMIMFSGEELYHFRITVVGNTKCTLSTEVLFYVVDPPLTMLDYWSLVSLTVVSFAVIIFMGYWTST
eukprot:TRINITY_DN11982_c0_g1_i1.p1 TRINITY_DN11982_c0_g1~~TRINITY_DN11982_c0_g1_i1.p1  ORF type:complete len:1299 (-),score=185.14 TRINITY_DN11982_c0_g1_i1:72-3968(-)